MALASRSLPAAATGHHARSSGCEVLELHGAAGIVAVNYDVGVPGVMSFLSADNRKTQCLYEADKATWKRSARRPGVPKPGALLTELRQVSGGPTISYW